MTTTDQISKIVEDMYGKQLLECIYDTNVFGVGISKGPASRYERLKWFLLSRFKRIPDAWKVLMGKADINSEYWS